MGDQRKRFEKKSEAYFGRAPDSTPDRKRLSLGRARRALASPKPDPASPDVCGRWQEESGQFVMLINQAGSHVECWLAPNSSASVRTNRQIHRLGGDRVSDRVFSLYVYPEPEKYGGRLEFVRPDRLRMVLSLGSWTEEAILVPLDIGEKRKRTTLSDSALDALPPEALPARLEERFPLTRQERSLLNEKLEASQLGPRIRSWLAVGNGSTVAERIRREREAKRIDDYLGEVFQGWHPDALPLISQRARFALARQVYKHRDVERSLLAWLENIVLRNDQDGYNAKKMPNAKSHLGLLGSRRERQFRYDVECVATGFAGDVGIGVGGFVGGIIVTKRDGVDKDAPVVWKQQYEIAFGGFSGGLSVGFQLGTWFTGTGFSYFDYDPADIPGPVTLFEAGATVALGAGGGRSVTAMDIHGSGALPKLFVNATGWVATAGLGWAGEVALTGGWILKVGRRFRAKSGVSVPFVDYAVESKSGHSCTFSGCTA